MQNHPDFSQPAPHSDSIAPGHGRLSQDAQQLLSKLQSEQSQGRITRDNFEEAIKNASPALKRELRQFLAAAKQQMQFPTVQTAVSPSTVLQTPTITAGVQPISSIPANIYNDLASQQQHVQLQLQQQQQQHVQQHPQQQQQQQQQHLQQQHSQQQHVQQQQQAAIARFVAQQQASNFPQLMNFPQQMLQQQLQQQQQQLYMQLRIQQQQQQQQEHAQQQQQHVQQQQHIQQQQAQQHIQQHVQQQNVQPFATFQQAQQLQALYQSFQALPNLQTQPQLQSQPQLQPQLQSQLQPQLQLPHASVTQPIVSQQQPTGAPPAAQAVLQREGRRNEAQLQQILNPDYKTKFANAKDLCSRLYLYTALTGQDRPVIMAQWMKKVETAAMTYQRDFETKLNVFDSKVSKMSSEKLSEEEKIYTENMIVEDEISAQQELQTQQQSHETQEFDMLSFGYGNNIFEFTSNPNGDYLDNESNCSIE